VVGAGRVGDGWVWLEAVGQATKRATIGTAVMPALTRYHPALVAQAWATLEVMFPGRTFLGIGSGESLNEGPLGAEWPPPGVQLVAMEEALELIRRLFAGERVTQEDRFPTKDAFLHTRPERPPPIYVSAFHEGAAHVAARFGDGLWTLAHPDSARDVIEAYETACADAGKEPGEIVLEAQFSRARASGRARSRRSSTPTTGTTRARWPRTPRRRSPTRRPPRS
jgi:coenzyme F420-dependent glucose-6-phosphate dehydrogenase